MANAMKRKMRSSRKHQRNPIPARMFWNNAVKRAEARAAIELSKAGKSDTE